MSKLILVSYNKKQVYKLVKELIYSCRILSNPIIDTKFNHNTLISNVPIILKSGILSKKEQAKYEGRELTKTELFRFSDDYHVNGLDYVSLSSMEIDFSKMNNSEYYYDPFNDIRTNIIVSRDVEAKRITINYFNEFLVENKIPVSKFNAIDTKVLKISDYKFHKTNENTDKNRIKTIIEYYESLKNIAKVLNDNNLNIPLREVSEEEITLDPEKVSKLPQLILK